jgi:hypothetical protein
VAPSGGEIRTTAGDGTDAFADNKKAIEHIMTNMVIDNFELPMRNPDW